MAELEDEAKPSANICETIAFGRPERVTSARGRFFDLVRSQITRLKCAGCGGVTYEIQMDDASSEEKKPMKSREDSVSEKQSCIPEEGRKAKILHNKPKVKLSTSTLINNKPKLCLSESKTIHNKPVLETSKQRSDSPENASSDKRVDVASKHRGDRKLTNRDPTLPDANLRQVVSSPPPKQVTPTARTDTANAKPQRTEEEHIVHAWSTDANSGPIKSSTASNTSLDPAFSETGHASLGIVNKATDNADNGTSGVTTTEHTRTRSPSPSPISAPPDYQKDVPSVSDTDPVRTYQPRRRHRFFCQPYEGGFFSYFGEEEFQLNSPSSLKQLAREAHDQLRRRRRRHWFYQQDFPPAFSVSLNSVCQEAS